MKINYLMDGRISVILESEDVEYAELLFSTGLDGYPGRRTRMQVISQLRQDGAGSYEYCVCLAHLAEGD